MLERAYNLFWSILLGLLGVLLAVIAWSNADRFSMPVLFGLGLAAAFCFAYAALIALAWSSDVIGGRWLYLYHEKRLADAITQESQLAEQYSRLTPEQIAALRILHPASVGVPGVAGATVEWELDGVRVPADFLHEYLDRCTDTHCYPVRRYSEGTPERMWATAIVAWLVDRRLAAPASGNAPARLTAGMDAVWRWFSLSEV